MAWEFDVLYALQSIHNPFLDKLMVLLSLLGEGGFLWILVAILFLCRKNSRPAGIQMVLSMLLTLIIGNLILKNLIARDRPCWIDTEVVLLTSNPRDYSFPSGHSMNGFAAAVVMLLEAFWPVRARTGGLKPSASGPNRTAGMEPSASGPNRTAGMEPSASGPNRTAGMEPSASGPKKTGGSGTFLTDDSVSLERWMAFTGLVIASAIAFSRLYNFVHFPTDVLCGIAIGSVDAILVHLLYGTYESKRRIRSSQKKQNKDNRNDSEVLYG